MGNYSSYQTEPFILSSASASASTAAYNAQKQPPKDTIGSKRQKAKNDAAADSKYTTKTANGFQPILDAAAPEDKEAIKAQKKIIDDAAATAKKAVNNINTIDKTGVWTPDSYLTMPYPKPQGLYFGVIGANKNKNENIVTREIAYAKTAHDALATATSAVLTAQKINKNRIATNAATARVEAARVAAEKAAKKTAADDAYAADGTFMLNAANFSNSKSEDLAAAWTAYTATRTSSTPIDTFLAKYDDFIAKKTPYITAVLQAMGPIRTTESTYVNNNQSVATELSNSTYMDIAKYNDMKNAWTAYKDIDLTANKITELLSKYKTYLDKKAVYQSALAEAQGKEGDATFIRNLASAKTSARQWISSASTGCRNIITSASTDQTQLKEAIQCKDTEFLSGYTKVSGYDSAPGYNAASTDSSINKDNIGNYLAYKYSCCTAPIGFVGNKGAAGLPGLNGTDGEKGPKGPKGVPGAKGPVGPAGPKGGQGKNGEQGEQGPDGARGPTGLKGENGKSVKARDIIQLPGPRGPKGPDGPEGPIGQPGMNGTPVVIEVKEPEPAPEEDSILELLALQNKIRHFFYG